MPPAIMRCKAMDDHLVAIIHQLGGTGLEGSFHSVATKDEKYMDDIEAKLELIEGLLDGSMAVVGSFRPSNARPSTGSRLGAVPNINMLSMPPNADELGARSRELRKVTTREQAVEADSNLKASIAGLYSKNGGDLAKIAKECGADQGLMKKHPPKSAEDFAAKLLLGIYTKAGTDITVKIGPPSSSQLQAQARQLKKTITAVKDMAPAENELQAISGIFQRCGGEPEKIASATGCCLQLLKKAPPKDGLDFAAKLLLGVYTDAFAVAGTPSGSVGRPVLSVADLQRCSGALKKVDLMTSSAVSLAVDLQNLQAVYDKHKGCLESLANVCGVSFAALQHNPPSDSLDFAERVLDGSYTDSQSEELRSKFGGYLMLDELMKQSAKLRSVSTSMGQNFKPSREELEAISKIWTEHDGDLEKIAKATGANLDLLRKKKPENPKDFAEKLMTGSYVGNKADIARLHLREKLSEDLLAKAKGLKKVVTKERGTTDISAAEMAAIKKMFDDAKGDWAKLAAASGANADVLAKKPPADAETFAKKMLEGCYVADASAVAWESLRKKLGEQLVQQKGALKKTDIKEGVASPMSTDVDIIGKIYDTNKGDLTQIAAICGIDAGVLRRSPPKDATEFATKLLGGAYTS